MSSRAGRQHTLFPGPPRYYQIAHTLESRIYHGVYRPGTTIPSETELTREFGVTRLTVRQALQQLIDRGILVPRRGSGTYVAEDPNVLRPVNFQGFLEDGTLQRLSMETVLLDVAEIPAPDLVADRLRLAPNAPVLFVERVRSVKGTPASHTVNYVPLPLGKQIPLEQLTQYAMSDLVRAYGGIRVLSAHQTLTAEGAPPDVAERLHIPVGAPLLRSDFLMGDGETPRNFAVVRYRPEFTFYTATLISLDSIAQPARHSPAPRVKATPPRTTRRAGSSRAGRATPRPA